MTLMINHHTVTLINTGLYESLKVGGWFRPYIGPNSSKNWQMPHYPDGVIHCAWGYPSWLLRISSFGQPLKAVCYGNSAGH